MFAPGYNDRETQSDEPSNPPAWPSQEQRNTEYQGVHGQPENTGLDRPPGLTAPSQTSQV